MTLPDCGLAEALLASRAAGTLAPDHQRLLDDHLVACPSCMRVARELATPVMVEALVGMAELEVRPPDETAPSPAELTIVPRAHYERGGEIGRGGMGRVVLARDARLGRAVAIKELLDRRLHPRFEREARLTARLQHPAIVAIHEAGRWPGGEPFYVMKYVAGRPLHEAIAQATTLAGRLALLSHFTTVAEAIAYAHSEGVIHRDLKPHNILLGAFGETVVIDWGLAKEVQGDAAATPEAHPPVEGMLTLAGAGTPAYMAPEQAAGEPLDEGVDIFALGATLHHILAGEPPGERELPPEVPAELRAVVHKAMAPRRADRYATAAELVDELRRFQTGQLVRAHRYSKRDLGRRWLRRHRGKLLGVASIAAALAAFVAAPRTASTGPSCDGGDARWAGVWDPAVRATIEQRFAASGRPYGEDTFRRIATTLDGYAARWRTMHREACEATVVHHEQSDAVLDLRMQCLDRRLGELRALTGLFAGPPNGELVDNAVLALGKLDDVAQCADRAALAANAPLPADPRVRGEILALQSGLHDAHALDLGGRFQPALARLGPVVAGADRLGYAPLQLEAYVELSDVQADLRDFTGAEASLHRQLALAAEIQADQAIAHAWIRLIRVLQYAHAAQALALRDVAELAVTRDRGAQRAELQAVLGEAYLAVGDDARAERALRDSIAALEHGGQSGDTHLASKYNSLGVVLKHAGKYAEARAAYRRAIEIFENRLGADHPYVAGTLTNVAGVLWLEGKYDEARTVNLRVLAVFEGAYGRDGASVAIPLDNIGEEEISLGRYDDAVAHLQRAIAIDERVSGADSEDLIPELASLGTALAYLGRHDEADRVLDRARGVCEASVGKDRREYADVLHHLGLVAQLRGRCRDAVALEQRAVAIDEKALSIDHPDLVPSLLGSGQCQLALGQPRAAIPVLERALAIRAAKGGDPAEVAEAQVALGQARWTLAHDDAAALAMIVTARTALAALGPVQQARAADVGRWLAARTGPR